MERHVDHSENLVSRERQQRGDARALDGVLQLALMQRARAGDAARKNLAALGDELLQRLHVLEVDVLDLLDAELADALAAIEELLLAALLSARTAAAAIIAAAARSARTSSRTTSRRCHVVSSLSLRRFLGAFHRRLLDRRSGSRSSGGRTHAVLLRIPLGQLLGALVILIRAHDHVPQDAVDVLHAPVELRQRRRALEHEQ